MKDTFRKYAVSAQSIEDFMTRYYKRDRYTGRGDDYAASLLASHREHYEQYGYDIISHHDSKTGDPVAWYGPEDSGA